MRLDGRTVVVGLSGGIACYKACEVVRLLVGAGARVPVIMTVGAQQFVTPLTLQTLSGQPVATDTFNLTQESEIGHIRLADAAECLLIAPATANVLAKLATGIADDLLTTVMLATRARAVVALVSGPVGLPPPPGVRLVTIATAAEMADAVEAALAPATVVVMCAAVADYRPRRPSARKMKKTPGTLTLELEPTRDILAGLGARKGERLLVGFAAETHRVAEEARRKLRAKHLDLIVANDVTALGAGFGADTNTVRFLDAEGLDETLPVLPKDEVASRIFDWVAARRTRSAARTSRL